MTMTSTANSTASIVPDARVLELAKQRAEDAGVITSQAEADVAIEWVRARIDPELRRLDEALDRQRSLTHAAWKQAVANQRSIPSRLRALKAKILEAVESWRAAEQAEAEARQAAAAKLLESQRRERLLAAAGEAAEEGDIEEARELIMAAGQDGAMGVVPVAKVRVKGLHVRVTGKVRVLDASKLKQEFLKLVPDEEAIARLAKAHGAGCIAMLGDTGAAVWEERRTEFTRSGGLG